MRPTTALYALAATLTMTTWGCSQAQQPQSTQSAQSENSGGGTGTGNDGYSGGSGTATGSGSGSSGGSSGSGQAASGDFNQWCQLAGQTQVASKTLGTYFQDLCSGGQATSLFTTTLVSLAYSGSGTPQVKYIQPISSDSSNSTTSAYFGVGMKLPISIQQHFTQIAPEQGDKDVETKLAEAQGATVQSMTVTPRQESDKYWVRGWAVQAQSTEQESIITLTVQDTVDSDQYQLQNGSLYMYTSVMDQTQPAQTIKDYSLLTAGMQINGTGYLITIAHVVIDNMGLSSVAEDKIKAMALSVIEAMYQTSVPGGASSSSSSSGGSGTN